MPRPNLKRPRRPWCIAIAIAIALVVIIVIVVPCAVILTRKNHGKKTNVLFPLYIWPTNDTTWDPLYDSVTAHPDLNFTIIINPSSGPGSTAYPSDEYASQVERLGTYSNVRKVGYVRTGYATRNITAVLDEVATYAGWSNESLTLAMDGIFFDEAPYDYSATKVEYMNTINAAVKNSSGLSGDRMVIHNPGTIPDTRYDSTTTDLTVVFESTYQDYFSVRHGLNALSADRTGYAYMLHAVPDNLSNSTLRKLVDQMSRKAEYLFLTTLSEDYYESFDPEGATIADLMPTRITSYPQLEFLVIVNPNSGPGALPSPDANYTREVARLNAYPNVYTVGYIRIDYCRKPLAAACDEIDRYASWAVDHATTGLGVGGIMVDETPNHHDAAQAQYLCALRDHIKASPGLLRDRLVVHNPGTPPDAEMADAGPDLIFVCEEPYARYRTNEVQHRLRELHYHRDRCGYMVTEVPCQEIPALVRDLRHRATYIFVTEIVGDFYERFGPTSWGAMMEALVEAEETAKTE
ncbi:spherulation-specific family 4 protein [Aspergillus ibericus CBS 121593]|uniref:Cell surface protein n=1 Tax=Aspergillus ibericus CBS 121593 TaxID=1448316 RepID=A0A395GKM4_9EURO|nr:hypothetical protein BO80DRAFT_419150 [Aspergillus ibericus CBS 121593]RAK95347.1 hypothetical protein BO80DRAFT_419150 [Aspergillus ibericus CBS 121593]